MQTIQRLTTVFLVLVSIFLSAEERRTDELVAHEWGTFTTLQDEQGRELNGINIDDEPVPAFVHNLSRYLLDPTFLTNEHWRRRMKGVPQNHPRVTMRLETPVIYFHPPRGAKTPIEVDVSVRFRRGWLTEFYPDARAEAPGLMKGFRFGEIEDSTVGSLEWKDLRVGTDGVGPKTDEEVWTTPRKVDSAPVTTAKGESEQYLFYRGVARLEAPLRAVTDPETGHIDVKANFGGAHVPENARIRALWLVDVDERGLVSFTEHRNVPVRGGKDGALVSFGAEREFESSELSLDALKKLMWIALTQDGLFSDEATAMLETWHRAYFESPGRRLFYVVPREWTDHSLPIEIPQADGIERVMIGRIELVTPEHRELLTKIREGDVPDASWVDRIPKTPARERFLAGRIDFGDLGVEIPAHYSTYLRLGRFRNALVVDEEQKRPSKALTAFVDAYGLRPYRPKATKEAVATSSK